MLTYQVPNYRPLGMPAVPRRMGQTGAQIGVGVSSLLATALGVGTTWIGIRAGKREKGNYSVMGYAVAVFGSIVVLSSLAATLGFFTGALGAKPQA